MDNVYLKLNEISILKNNWNGYGAKPIPKIVIQKVGNLLTLNFKDKPKIFPTARESIQLE